MLKETIADSILDMMRKEESYLDKINKIIDWDRIKEKLEKKCIDL